MNRKRAILQVGAIGATFMVIATTNAITDTSVASSLPADEIVGTTKSNINTGGGQQLAQLDFLPGGRHEVAVSCGWIPPPRCPSQTRICLYECTPSGKVIVKDSDGSKEICDFVLADALQACPTLHLNDRSVVSTGLIAANWQTNPLDSPSVVVLSQPDLSGAYAHQLAALLGASRNRVSLSNVHEIAFAPPEATEYKLDRGNGSSARTVKLYLAGDSKAVVRIELPDGSARELPPGKWRKLPTGGFAVELTTSSGKSVTLLKQVDDRLEANSWEAVTNDRGAVTFVASRSSSGAMLKPEDWKAFSIDNKDPVAFIKTTGDVATK